MVSDSASVPREEPALNLEVEAGSGLKMPVEPRPGLGDLFLPHSYSRSSPAGPFNHPREKQSCDHSDNMSPESKEQIKLLNRNVKQQGSHLQERPGRNTRSRVPSHKGHSGLGVPQT